MRIAIYHNLPSGGGKRALYEMTSRLTQRHEIDVYTLSTANNRFCDIRPFCNQHVIYQYQPLPLTMRPFGRLNQAIRSLDLQRLSNLQKKIACDIDAKEYDLAFTHICQYGNSPAILRHLRLPTAYYCAEPPRLLYEPSVGRPYLSYGSFQKIGNLFDPFPALYRRVFSKHDRESAGAASLILTNSEYSRETIYRVYGKFAIFSRLGVDTKLFRPLHLDKDNMVLSVGSLTAKKGFDFIIQSLSYIADAERPRLIIVSNFVDENEHRYLQNLADQLSVTVLFKTGISDEHLVQLYNHALLTVYAPIMEPFGFVPLESFACGTPVVGVREGGVRETVHHGENGFLTDRDQKEFADAIHKLIYDDDLRRLMQENAHTYVEEEWSWDRSIASLEKQFARIT